MSWERLEVPTRDVWVRAPEGGPHPVLYLHDAQNLFDPALATSGGAIWDVDAAAEGLDLIVVGIPHGGERRGHELAGDGRDEFRAWLVDEVKPRVDEAFDTRGDATGIGGSSLGGVAALDTLLARPDVFTRALVMSPAFWWNGGRTFEAVERLERPHGRIWIDVGGREHADAKIRSAYVSDFERMVRMLRERGYGDEALQAVYDADAIHHESAWAARLPEALRFLYP